MGPASRVRGGQRQLELDLTKYVSLLNSVPDETTMGKLQDALETLLSERSHPMIMALSKQRDQLQRANDVIGHEMELRKSRRVSAKLDTDERPSRKRRRSHAVVDVKQRDSETPGTEEPTSESPETEIDGNVDVNEQNETESLAAEPNSSSESLNNASEDVLSIEENGDQADSEENDSDVMADDTAATELSQTEEISKDSEENSDGLTNERENDDDLSNEDAQDATATTTNGDAEASTVKHKNTSEKTLAGSKPEVSAGNNKFVANPKSEYVSTQSLPVHTFSVFKEGDEENEDEEAYKRRLGVVSYPKEDLSTLTAGPVPTDDYTRAKPSNQVQFSTYATFLEPYFRPFTEEDIQFLQQPAVGAGVEAVNLKTGKKMSPYVFPPLGSHYHQNWAIQDAELSGQEVSTSTRKSFEAQVAELNKVYDAAGSVSDLNDSNLEASPPSVSLGPFTERLIAAVISEALDSSENFHHTTTTNNNGTVTSDGAATAAPASPSSIVEKTVACIPPPPQNTPSITDFTELEERIKNEFRYVGVLDVGLLRQFEQHKSDFKLATSRVRDEFSDPTVMDVDWVNGSCDDEISRVLRFLQARLKEVSRRNTMYKQQLLPVIQEQLSWQEYQSILQDLDKQVDQAYQKRLKAPQANKQKKKKGPLDNPYESNAGTPQSVSASTPDSSKLGGEQKPTIKALIDKRERWVSKIGPLFKPAHKMMREYESPKFISLEDDDEEDDEEDRDE